MFAQGLAKLTAGIQSSQPIFNSLLSITLLIFLLNKVLALKGAPKAKHKSDRGFQRATTAAMKHKCRLPSPPGIQPSQHFFKAFAP
jgi:hypothetical protein